MTLFHLKNWRNIQQKEFLMLGFNTSSEKQFLFTNKFNEIYYPQAVNDWLYWIYDKYDYVDKKNKKQAKKNYNQLLNDLKDNPNIDSETRFKMQKELVLNEKILEHKHVPLKRITPHGFRYTHCSLLFEAGASIKEVQARLGHKDVQTTMNIYAYVTPQMIENTGEKFANYIGF